MEPSLVPVRVTITDDDASFAESLALLVNGSPGLECVGRYADGESAIPGLLDDKPDVALMDIQMPGQTGIECIRKLKPKLPKTQFVVLTSYTDDRRVFESLKAGATGYMLKRSAPLEILQAIEQVRSGGSPMSGYIARRVVESFGSGANAPAAANVDLPRLSPREESVVVLLSRGYLYKEIADELSIGVETVRTHLRRIYEKLQVRTRTEAVVKYLGR
jgi:DNA-binding NarL/FixJ family response regulator